VGGRPGNAQMMGRSVQPNNPSPRARAQGWSGDMCTLPFLRDMTRPPSTHANAPPPPPLPLVPPLHSAGFYGASIAAVADLWEPHGYTLVAAQLDDPEHNVILVRDDALAAAPRVAADKARAAALVPGAFPTDVCTLYYTAMAPQPVPAAAEPGAAHPAKPSPLSPGYHCIHACEDDSPNYDGLAPGAFDVTKAWQEFGLGRGSSVDQVFSLVHGVFASAAADHEARVGGEGVARNAFAMGVLRHLDPAQCGAGLPSGRRYEKFLG